jgi:hypothetical protein
LAPALAACGADLRIQRNSKESWNEYWLYIPTLYAPPRRGVASDTVLAPGDILVCASISTVPLRPVSVYEEIRQKSAFDWALVSCVAGLGQANYSNGKIVGGYFPSIWLGGVAPTPWRATAAEAVWEGVFEDGDRATKRIDAIAEAAVTGATPLPEQRLRRTRPGRAEDPLRPSPHEGSVLPAAAGGRRAERGPHRDLVVRTDVRRARRRRVVGAPHGLRRSRPSLLRASARTLTPEF